MIAKKSKQVEYNLENPKDRFVLFLKRHDLLIPFINNHSIRNKHLSNLISRTKTETFSKYLNRVNPIDYMDKCFLKKETTEGKQYWEWYSYKWKAIQDNNLIYWKFVKYFVEKDK